MTRRTSFSLSYWLVALVAILQQEQWSESPTLAVTAFVVPSSPVGVSTTKVLPSRVASDVSTSALFAENKKKKGGLDEGMRSKLVTETIAPWRTLRLFLYAALGSGALLGGFINASELAGAMSTGKEFDMNTEVSRIGMLAVEYDERF